MDNTVPVTVMVITDGRGDCLHRTMESLKATWPASIPYHKKLLVCDSLNEGYRNELRELYPDFNILTADRKLGFHGAIQLGWDNLEESTWIFHLEDDFDLTPVGEIPLEGMRQVVQESRSGHHPLAQVALKRQAWNEEEKKAGGIVEMWPDLYEDREISGFNVAVHNNFFTTNPTLYHHYIAKRGWPQVPQSEQVFTRELQDDGFKFAFWGKKLDAPRVEHIGEHRVGTGY